MAFIQPLLERLIPAALGAFCRSSIDTALEWLLLGVAFFRVHSLHLLVLLLVQRLNSLHILGGHHHLVLWQLHAVPLGLFAYTDDHTVLRALG